MAIDIAGSLVYFALHVQEPTWKALDSDLRTRAIGHAKRQIKAFLYQSTEYVETLTDDDDHPRHDAATYEQALFLVCNSPLLQDGTSGIPTQLATTPGTGDNTKPPDPSGICKAARFYLIGTGRGNAQVMLCRG